jgi:hypothetical protein
MTIMLLLLPSDPLSLETFSLTINLLIQSWLTTSPGVAAYAENRVKFDGAFKNSPDNIWYEAPKK